MARSFTKDTDHIKPVESVAAESFSAFDIEKATITNKPRKRSALRVGLHARRATRRSPGTCSSFGPGPRLQEQRLARDQGAAPSSDRIHRRRAGHRCV
jgi:hypothetical protein